MYCTRLLSAFEFLAIRAEPFLEKKKTASARRGRVAEQDGMQQGEERRHDKTRDGVAIY